MAEELEIKLTMTPEALLQAKAWLMRQNGAKDAGSKALQNCYYDTPDAALNRQKIALRVRQAGDRYIQTLKTQGDYVDGAHRRQEWEWPLTGTRLNIGLIADTPVGQDVNLARLGPVFETNFQRQVILIETGNAAVECALDDGHIVAGDRTQALCELEFELKQGDAGELLALTRRLAAEVPIFINLISKAEQGYYLARDLLTDDVSTAGYQPTAPGDQQALVTRILHGLSRSWLTGELDTELPAALDDAEARASDNMQLLAELNWLRGNLAPGRGPGSLVGNLRLGQCQVALLDLL